VIASCRAGIMFVQSVGDSVLEVCDALVASAWLIINLVDMEEPKLCNVVGLRLVCALN
jgi:hypothetical protein